MGIKWRNIYWRGPGDSIAETTLFDTKQEALRDSTQGFLSYRDTIAVHVQENTMFEVGKKYKNVYRNDTIPLTCVWTDGDVACMKSDLGVTIRYAENFKQYTEYKEPVKHVRYFNVYPAGSSDEDAWMSAYHSRPEADRGASEDRIGCVRVEFTEGTYDD